LEFSKNESVKNISAAINIFVTVDQLMTEFLESNPSNPIAYEIRGGKGITTPATIFAHVTTHEFHHKGQILSISRHLGYVPVDTDIIR